MLLESQDNHGSPRRFAHRPENSFVLEKFGGSDVDTFPLLVSVSLESIAVESRLILVVVTPQRIKNVKAKVEQLELQRD